MKEDRSFTMVMILLILVVFAIVLSSVALSKTMQTSTNLTPQQIIELDNIINNTNITSQGCLAATCFTDEFVPPNETNTNADSTFFSTFEGKVNCLSLNTQIVQIGENGQLTPETLSFDSFVLSSSGIISVNLFQMETSMAISETLRVGAFTTTERLALSPEQGTIVYDSTIGVLSIYQSNAWFLVSGASGVSSISSSTLSITGTNSDPIIDLISTGITANTYQMPTIQFNAYGIALSAIDNTLTGTTNQIDVSSFPNPVISLSSSFVTLVNGKVNKSGDTMTGSLNSTFVGSQTNPNFAINSTNGIFQSNTNFLSFSTNGVKRMDMNSTGDIIIVSLSSGVVKSDINGKLANGLVQNSELVTLTTSNLVANSATTATSANTPSTIVSRDAFGNFIAGTITATSIVGANVVTNTTNLSTPGHLVSYSDSVGKVIVDSGVISANVVTNTTNVSTSGHLVSYSDSAGKVIVDSGVVASTLTGGPFLPLAGGTMTAQLNSTFVGSASSPNFAINSVNGMFQSATNFVSFATNGVKRVDINSTGGVAISSLSTGVVKSDVNGLLYYGTVSNAEIATQTPLSQINSIVSRDASRNFAANMITLSGTTTNSTDVATKNYVDTTVNTAISLGLSVKQPVIAVSVVPITSPPTGLLTIDTSVLLVDGDRVLLVAQVNEIYNGAWIAHIGLWTRPTDFDNGDTAGTAYFLVQMGTDYAGSSWVCSSPSSVIGTDPLTFSQFSSPQSATGINDDSVDAVIYKNSLGSTLHFYSLLNDTNGYLTMTNTTNSVQFTINATSANTSNAIVARDSSGDFLANNINLSTGLIVSSGSFGSPSIRVGPVATGISSSAGNLQLSTAFGIGLSIASATGIVTLPSLTSVGIVHNSSSGVLSTSLIVNADIDPSAAIVDTKLATISTSNKVSNSATTATSANTASAIVARDGSGNFSAGVITATSIIGANVVTNTTNTSTIGHLVSYSDVLGKVIVDSGVVASTLTGGPFLPLTGGVMSGSITGVTQLGIANVNSSVIMGTSNTTGGGLYDVIIGLGAATTGVNGRNVAIGHTSSSFEDGVAIGDISLASGSGAISIGSLSQATNQYNVALGRSTLSSGLNAVAVGSAAQATGTLSLAIGPSTIASNGRAIACGSNTTASGDTAVAIGHSCLSSGPSSLSFGSSVISSATNSICIGINITNNVAYSTVIGDVLHTHIRGANTTTDLGSLTVPFQSLYLNTSLYGTSNSRLVDDIVSNGGVGTSGNLASFVSNKVIQDSGIAASSVTTGGPYLLLAGGTMAGTLNMNTNSISNGGVITITNTTDSTTSITGSLITSGGIGLSKQITIGTNCKVLGTTDSTSSISGSLITAGGLGVAKAVFVGSSSSSSLTSNGSIVTAGGIGVAKNILAGDQIKTNSTTASTSTTSGSIVAGGGLGVAGAINAGSFISGTKFEASAPSVFVALTTAQSTVIGFSTGVNKLVDITNFSIALNPASEWKVTASTGACQYTGNTTKYFKIEILFNFAPTASSQSIYAWVAKNATNPPASPTTVVALFVQTGAAPSNQYMWLYCSGVYQMALNDTIQLAAQYGSNTNVPFRDCQYTITPIN